MAKKKPRTRRDISIHRVFPLLKDFGTHPSLDKIGFAHIIRGEIGNHIVVSIPETESQATAEAISKLMEKELKRPVLVISHNMELLCVQRVPPKERAKLVRQLEVVGNEADSGSDSLDPAAGLQDAGDRSRLLKSGGNGRRVPPGSEGKDSGDEADQDEEGTEEGT
jgi:hypothetical protein